MRQSFEKVWRLLVFPESADPPLSWSRPCPLEHGTLSEALRRVAYLSRAAA